MTHGAARAEIERRVIAIASEKLGVDESLVRPGHDRFRDQGADSLAILGFVLAIEREFHVEVDDEAVARLATVSDVVQFVVDATS